jgi:hypothetical protein
VRTDAQTERERASLEDLRAAAGATHAPPGDDELVGHLERDQLVAETLKPVPRARLSPRAIAALWALRMFVVVVGAMVVYTFVAELH